MENKEYLPKYPLQTLSKALEILKYMRETSSSTGVTLNNISKNLGISKSSAHRILDTLLSYGFVEKTSTAIVSYNLSWEAYKTGCVVPDSHTLNASNYVQIVESLSKELNKTVSINIYEKNITYILYKAVPDMVNYVRSFFGEHKPLYATAAGKLFMLNFSTDEILHYFQNTDIKKYMDYLKSINLEVSDVVENDIIGYIINLEKDSVSVATVSRMISSIKSFHDYLFLNHITDNNPAKTIKKPKVEKHEVDILTEKEIEALLNFPKLDTPKLIRDKAIFEVLYGTGIKVSELVDMDIEDVDLELDYIYCNIAKNKRVIPLSDTTKVYLEKYIKEARPKITEDTENALFVNSLGQRFTRQGLWKLIKKYASIANINKNINPSMLRHSFAIHLLNEGANIAVVSKILGNANLSSLQAYLNHINKNMRREIKEKHPRK